MGFVMTLYDPCLPQKAWSRVKGGRVRTKLNEVGCHDVRQGTAGCDVGLGMVGMVSLEQRSLLTKGLHWQMMMWVFWQVVQFQAILGSAEDEYMFWHHLSWMTGKYKIWSNGCGLSSTEEPIQILNQGLLPAFRGREIWFERGTHGQGTMWSRRVPIPRNTYPSGHMTHLGLSMMEVKHQYCHANREGAHGHDRLEIYTWNHRRKPGQP